MHKVWIEAALNGPWSRALQPGIPDTIEAIVAEGIACAEAGAAIIHTHAYDGGGPQTFDWPVTNGEYDSDESICVNPQGTVRDRSGKVGSWEMDDELVLSWGGLSREYWSMPLNPSAQRIKGAAGVAKRLSRGKFGKTQG